MLVTSELSEVVTLTLFPTVLMALGSVIVQFFTPGPMLVATFQHLSSGIILSALATELMPKIQSAVMHSPNVPRNTGIGMFGFGFTFGFIFLIAVGRISDYFAPEEEEDDEKDEGGHSNKHVHQHRAPLTLQRRLSLSNMPIATNTSFGTFERSPVLGPAKKAPTPEMKSLEGGDEVGHSQTMPWGLLAVVTIDSFLDGALIGLSAHAGDKIGFMITVALSVEMTFLGITTSGSLVKRGISRGTAIAVCVFIPMFLIVGGVVGSSICASLSPSGLIAGLSFGAAALIYLVTDELLVEAHENIEYDTWYVTAHLFLGFMGSTMFTMYNE